MENVTISAVILAKNEEARIGRCLSSLEWISDRIVIDNGSADNTVAIARQYDVRVFSSSEESFSALRNLGKAKAKGDWILYIDADEVVTESLRDEIQRTMSLFRTNKSPTAYFLKRKNYYLSKPWPTTDKMERLFVKDALLRWEGQLHEKPVYTGTCAVLIETLIHDSHRTLEEMVDKTNAWSEIEAELRFEAKHPYVTWWRIFRVFLTGFSGSYIGQGGYRAGTAGIIESIYQGFSMFITYAKLWERQELQKNS